MFLMALAALAAGAWVTVTPLLELAVGRRTLHSSVASAPLALHVAPGVAAIVAGVGLLAGGRRFDVSGRGRALLLWSGLLGLVASVWIVFGPHVWGALNLKEPSPPRATAASQPHPHHSVRYRALAEDLASHVAPGFVLTWSSAGALVLLADRRG